MLLLLRGSRNIFCISFCELLEMSKGPGLDIFRHSAMPQAERLWVIRVDKSFSKIIYDP